jgi:ADP-ribosylglycohydrolase
LTKFIAPDKDNFLFGMEAGEVTDGPSQALLLVDVLLRTQDERVSATYFDDLRGWLRESEFAKFVGPTTARALQGGPPAPQDNENGSNGAAMRTTPIGWFCAGDPERAVKLAIDVASITHTGTAVVGAAMVSAAVAVALSGGLPKDVLAAAYDAIRQVDAKIHVPRSAAAMKKALDEIRVVAERCASCDSLSGRLNEFAYPTSTSATGSVVAAIGCALACPNNPFGALVLAVNAGDDTHTTAMMAGAICGAMVGDTIIPPDLLGQLKEVNERLHRIDLDQIAEQAASLIVTRSEK